MALFRKDVNKKLAKQITKLERLGFLPENWFWHKDKVEEIKGTAEDLIKLFESSSELSEKFVRVKSLSELLHRSLETMMPEKEPSAEVQKSQAESVNSLIAQITITARKILPEKLVMAEPSGMLKKWLTRAVLGAKLVSGPAAAAKVQEPVKIERPFEPGAAEAEELLLAKAKLNIKDYGSRKNNSRPVRPYTNYIILHTTEGGAAGALNKLSRNGEAHYLVAKDGTVYRIVNRHKIAKHAGRSMWEGKKNIDKYSIGIEVEGTHNKDITSSQYEALRLLLNELQKIYNISDSSVLAHAMVAYAQNKWHPVPARGRKWCGRRFAKPDVRKRMGLGPAPDDPDVKAGRVVIDDKESRKLFEYLYGKVPTSADIKPSKPPKKEKEVPEGFDDFAEIPKDGKTAWSIAKGAYKKPTTIYFLPDGRVRRGDELTKDQLDHLPNGTKILLGYIYGGHIKQSRSAYSVVGKEWNYPSTFYRLPDGKIVSGDDISEGAIPKGTLILFRD